MRTEKLHMSEEQKQQIINMLKSQGISQSEIDEIINGDYENYDRESDLERAYGGVKKHGDILEKLSDGYVLEELQGLGLSPEKIQQFKEMLDTRNLTLDGAKAIYQYSIGSNMILGVKRGTEKKTIREQIITDLDEALRGRGVAEADIEKMKKFVQSADYQISLHSNYDVANQQMEQMGFQQNARVSVRSAMLSIDRLTHIDETISALEDGIGSTYLSKSMKLYRAVKSSYLEKRLGEGADFRSLVGKSISNKGQTSTSPLYDSSFASLDGYDTVFEIYVPKGSRGAYIAELSAYDKTEQEVLLNPNDLYITGVQMGVIDKNGRTKNVIQALCLSKDRECYKGTVQQQEQLQQSDSLPIEQNRFSKFFSRVRAILARILNKQLQPEKKTYLKQQDKPWWELDIGKRKEIQKGTRKIGRKYLKMKPRKTPKEEVEKTHDIMK